MNAQTKISVKGQVVIPKDVRDALAWGHGTELEVVKGANSVLLKPVSNKRKTISWAEFDQLIPPHDGPYIPESEWGDAIADMFRREWR